MFKNTFQSGFLSILYSIGSKPLQIWDKKGARPLALPAGRLARGVLLWRQALIYLQQPLAQHHQVTLLPSEFFKHTVQS